MTRDLQSSELSRLKHLAWLGKHALCWFYGRNQWSDTGKHGWRVMDLAGRYKGTFDEAAELRQQISEFSNQ